MELDRSTAGAALQDWSGLQVGEDTRDSRTELSFHTIRVSETGSHDDEAWTYATGLVERHGVIKILRMKADTASRWNLIVLSKALELADAILENEDIPDLTGLSRCQVPVLGKVWLKFFLRGEPRQNYEGCFYVIPDDYVHLAFSALACAKLSKEMKIVDQGENADQIR